MPRLPPENGREGEVARARRGGNIGGLSRGQRAVDNSLAQGIRRPTRHGTLSRRSELCRACCDWGGQDTERCREWGGALSLTPRSFVAESSIFLISIHWAATTLRACGQVPQGWQAST